MGLEVDASFVVALVGLIISVGSMLFSIYFGNKRQKHSMFSVRPICYIFHSNYSNYISVGIRNSGTGPMIIKKISYTHKYGEEVKSLFDALPELVQKEAMYSAFTDDDVADGLSFAVNQSMYLLCINPRNEDIRSLIRNALGSIIVNVEYTDIYNTRYVTVMRDLKILVRDNDVETQLSFEDMPKADEWR